MRRSHNRVETFEQWRQRMLDDTSRFIEWGLRNPDEVEWIPRHPVGTAAFPDRVKRLCWTLILSNKDMPE
jgi:hypothetical protein